MSKKFLLLAAASVLIVTPATARNGQPTFAPWGVDLTAMDRTVKPGDNFFQYVNGTWAKRTEIAPDRTFVGIDSVLNDQLDSDVRDIVEDMAKDSASSGRIGQQIGDFYASWMDEASITAKGTAPLKPHLDKIAAAKDKGELVELFATIGYPSPIGMAIYPDLSDPTRYGVYAGQAGLGMPNRDYYLLEGAKYDAYRTAYKAYIARIEQLAGIPDAAAKADKIFALETAIAKVHWKPEDSRDVSKIYNPMDIAKLQAFAPEIDWKRGLAKSGLANVSTVVVTETTAVQEIAKLVESVPLETWKDYMAFHFISSHASYLPKQFDQARFDFYSKTLRDVPNQRDRWKRGVDLVNGALGEAVGQIYVQRHYPPEASRQMGELIDNFRSALADKIQNNSWMDAATKKEALAKLGTFDPRTGHPSKYIDYSSLAVDRSDLFGNVLRSEKFDWELLLERMKKPVDRTLWGMTPQTNNAYYDPTQNQITFPAGILQPPYFDPDADAAANYGSIGATIGHEIGHGFDDQGRKFDGSGKLRDWWTEASAKQYDARASKLVKQYDAYEPIPGVHIKGQLTLGENLGDLGGLEVAYSAYRRYVAKHGEPPVINGMTGDQRFFIAYGYSWQRKNREGALRAQLLADEHSPAEYRVNGVVRNMDEWYKAFNVKPGDKMYLPPEERVRIW
ncbi:MAG TPA: M13 family metallopeptidase [Sphingomicrobium sp.]|nr:M13 family metallopeptidase [Sphingomicrobium sp.]